MSWTERRASRQPDEPEPRRRVEWRPDWTFGFGEGTGWQHLEVGDYVERDGSVHGRTSRGYYSMNLRSIQR